MESVGSDERDDIVDIIGPAESGIGPIEVGGDLVCNGIGKGEVCKGEVKGNVDKGKLGKGRTEDVGVGVVVEPVRVDNDIDIVCVPEP